MTLNKQIQSVTQFVASNTTFQQFVVLDSAPPRGRGRDAAETGRGLFSFSVLLSLFPFSITTRVLSITPERGCVCECVRERKELKAG